MDGSTVVISPPDGDMATYLASLERLKGLRPRLRTIAPAHGHLIEDPLARIDGYLAHRAEREAQVLAVLQRGPAKITAIVEELYADVATELHPVAARTVWAHLRKLADEGKATAKGRSFDGTWRAA